MLHSYPSIYNIGHGAIRELTLGDVIVEEKVDGSQFSMGVTEEGELLCRSKGAPLHVDAPAKMFAAGVETAKRLAPLLHPGWVYRGEYLGKPKHNTLAYDRVPVGHVILFDVNTGHEAYLSWEDKKAEADRIGLECVPRLFQGRIESAAEFRRFLDTESVLGGQKIEGVVVKPATYSLFGADKKVLIGKFVSEAFKEIHGGEWRKANPVAKDIVQQIVDRFRTPARWSKAVQHLREAGQLEDSPRDIGRLIREVPEDVLRECEAEMKEQLWSWAWDHVQRGLTNGLPQWYKEQLVEKQFESEVKQ